VTRQDALDRLGIRDPGVRAGDADREWVADRLREAHADGRLELTEFEHRLERSNSAKTLGDLVELVQDLPRPVDPDIRQSLGRFGRWRWPLGPLAPLLIALIVVAGVTGHHLLWLAIPLFFFWRLSWWRRRHWSAGAHRGPGQWI
jgi:hypothetical protein